MPDAALILLVPGALPFLVWRVWHGLGLPDSHAHRDQRRRDMLKPKRRK